MKRLFSLFMIVASAAMTLVSCSKTEQKDTPGKKDGEITEIYIFGAATNTGTSLENMEKFQETGGFYTWEGYLKADLPFKFPTQKTSEWPALMIKADGETLVLAKDDADVVVYTVDIDGTYEITIDTRDKNNMYCVVDLIKPDMKKVKIDELYLLGDATPSGWALASMEQFTKDGAIFTWEGPLKAGLRFRFPLQKDPGTSVDDAKWWPCLCCHEGGVIEYAMGDEDESNVPVEVDGTYEIIVNTTDRDNMTYTIELKDPGLPDPVIDEIYILGDAAPGGWALDLAPKFENNDRIFTWTGDIKSSGQFRFNTTNQNWFPAICLEKGTQNPVYVDVWDDTLYDQFTVAESATYNIEINAKKYDQITVKIVKAGSTIPVTELYILGDATENGWALDTMPAFTNDNYTFTWEGKLSSTGAFRFPTQRIPNVWWPCLCIETATGDLFNVTESDWNTGLFSQLTVAETGTYKIVVDGHDIDDLSYTITKK